MGKIYKTFAHCSCSDVIWLIGLEGRYAKFYTSWQVLTCGESSIYHAYSRDTSHSGRSCIIVTCPCPHTGNMCHVEDSVIHGNLTLCYLRDATHYAMVYNCCISTPFWRLFMYFRCYFSNQINSNQCYDIPLLCKWITCGISYFSDVIDYILIYWKILKCGNP